MGNRITAKVVVVLLGLLGTCWACQCQSKGSLCTQAQKLTSPDPVDRILERLKDTTRELKTYQAQIEHLFTQAPGILDSTTLKKGTLYYAKFDKKSKLRINFKTQKQDDEKQQKYRDEYIFDGMWFTYIDYELKNVKSRQLAEPNEPIDAFELVSRSFPIIGFTKTEELKKDFEIKLVEQKKEQAEKFIQLHLKVRDDSVHKDDYNSIDFWIDKKVYLPAKIIATTVDEDIYEITFSKPKVNKKLSGKIFDYKIPKGFTIEKTPLKNSNNSANK